MKKTKLLTIIILICLTTFSVLSLLLADDGGKQKYETALALATDYADRGLYQLAIIEYDKAIAIKDSEKLRDAILEAYEKRYEESNLIIDQYVSAAESAVSFYSKNENYYVILANAYLRSDNYQSAYKVLNNAKKNGIDTEKIKKLYMDTKYAFETKWYTYTDFISCTKGLYVVMNSQMYGYIDEIGNSEKGFDYYFASQLGEEGIRIICGEENILLDGTGVVRGRLSFVPTDSQTYAEGYIAIKKDKSFGYYNSLGDFQFGEYIAASNFQNAKAAVCPEKDKYLFVDTSGKALSDVTYQDIKINLDGSYLIDGVMLAKLDGNYKLYDQDGKQISDFECDNIDVITNDGIIAFEKNGKWGFVNTSGDIVIEPNFDNAKSFSNGLAAVCIDDKWGYVSNDGQVVIDYQFFDADYFNSEMNCLVKTTPSDWQMIELKVKF